MLSAISLLFPLSNLFLDLLTVSKYGLPFARLSGQAIAALATLACIFVVFATFGRRDDFHIPENRRRFKRGARVAFVVAITSCVVYLLGYQLAYNGKVHLSNEVAVLAHDAVFAVLYISFFTLMTRAFLLLAMLEYFPGSPRGGVSGSVRTPPD